MSETNKFYDDKDIPTAIKTSIFNDGMVVTAEDLTVAMNYPVELFRALNRTYFSCGIVCGLKLETPSDGEDNNFKVRINAGLALDSNGYPLYVVETCDLDLTPDPCSCIDDEKFCIAMRRLVVKEGLREDGDICDASGKPKLDYRRAREAVRVSVFKKSELPAEICKHSSGAGNSNTDDICDCLKACDDRRCLTEPAWVLLGCVTVTNNGVSLISGEPRVRYVKPIACQCSTGGEGPSSDIPSSGNNTLTEYIERQNKLEEQLADREKALADREKSLDKKLADIEGLITTLAKKSAGVEKIVAEKFKSLEGIKNKVEEKSQTDKKDKDTAGKTEKPASTKSGAPKS